VEIAGAQWEVWYGPNNAWNTVTYKRAPVTSSVTGLDLLPFFQDSVTRGYAASTDYLLGIQAGFEIWVGNNEAYSTSNYSVSVN
jgi:cellulose 1,4-beta-cellobiosidase